MNKIMHGNEKIPVMFAINYALSRGEGRSRILLEYARGLDHNKFQISILQFEGSRFSVLTEEEIINYTAADKLYTLKSNDVPLLPLYSRGIIGYLLTVLLQPFLFRIRRKEINRMIGRENMVVYLFENNLTFLFGKEKTLIGSTHSWNLSNIGILKKINIGVRVKLWGINYFHVFPQFRNALPLLKPHKYLIMGNGVDANTYVPGTRVKKDSVRILYVGRLEKCKGIIFFLKVAEAFKDNDSLIFTVVGSGTLRGYVESVSQKYTNIKYLGSVDDKQLVELYQDSLLLLFPSNCDTFGMAVLEALSCGTRVLGSEKLASVFQQAADRGYFTPLPNDVLSYVENINSAVKNADAIENDRVKQHEFVAGEYSWRTLMEKLDEFLTSVSDDMTV
jgi:glycosyltransferase involved in cell wall biosynthesis